MKAGRLFKMASGKILEGVFAINKPMGMSSAQVIRDTQVHFNSSRLFAPLIEQEISRRNVENKWERHRRSKAKREIRVKLGHGGTLDPLATGVLILGVGKGTKSLQGFLECKKTYETVVVFGASTDTYDRVGRILKKASYDHITEQMVTDALGGFKGRFQQVPPLYSALKMEGKPLYEYAREGKPIPRDIPTREVEVDELELVEWMEPGSHNHWWPTEEASSAEQTVAEQVWRAEKQQQTMKKLTEEEEKEEQDALEEHASFKRKAEERQDELVRDAPSKKRRRFLEDPIMSGALGNLPTSSVKPKGGKGSNLIPAPPAANTPPPWDGKGPPAARIRLTVSSGFYVRSFCHDLGEKVGSRAMMAELVRSHQAGFTVGTPTCLEFTDLDKGEQVWAPLVEAMLVSWANRGRSTPDRDVAEPGPSSSSTVAVDAVDEVAIKTPPPSAEAAAKVTQEQQPEPEPETAPAQPEQDEVMADAATESAEPQIEASKQTPEDSTKAAADVPAEPAAEETQSNAVEPQTAPTATAVETTTPSEAAPAPPQTKPAGDDEEWNGIEDEPAPTRV